MISLSIHHFLIVSAIVFSLGVMGIFLNRRSILSIFMSIEIILLAVNINFVAFSRELGDLTGQVFSFFILTIAAAEVAIGLAILVIYFKERIDITVDLASKLKG
jgi:NADH-quinone oxidoreductase subunit K